MSFPRFVIPFFLPLVAGLALLTGAWAAPMALTGASYAADGGLLVASNKTSTDHFVSMVSNKDCALWRALRGPAVCKGRGGAQNPYDVHHTQPHRTVAEEGVQKAPPLRPLPAAPSPRRGAPPSKNAPPPP